MSIQRLLSTLSRVLVSKMTFDGSSSSAYMPGAVDSAACRLFLKMRMATLDEWLPLKQFLTSDLRQKAQSFSGLLCLPLLLVVRPGRAFNALQIKPRKDHLFR